MSKYTSFKLKLIYVFRINDEAHKGCLKIGEATIEGDKHSDFKPNSKDLNQAAKARINQYTQTAGVHYELLHAQIAMKDYHAISDHDVHKVLQRSGIKQNFFDSAHKKNEWFICNLETAKAAIEAALNGQSAINALTTTEVPDPIIFRQEQTDAINDAVKRFKAGHKKFLWNAKMRFGKTLCALQVVKELQFKRVIIFTHRPDVLDGWHDDFAKIFFEPNTNYRFCAKRIGLEIAEAEKRAQQEPEASYIYFASTQDLRGSQIVGGKFDKNNQVFSTKWDLVIIDEAHEGLQTELGKSVRNALCGGSAKQLLLSGTPFNLFDEFDSDEMFTWDYVMEQKAKADWTRNHYGDSNPYEVLPVMHILTFSLGEMLHGEIEYADIDDKAFNFREFFRTFKGDIKEDHRPIPKGSKPGDFVHERDVKSFLKLLVTPNEENNMPFATEYNRNNFRHTLWMVPGVPEGAALARLLNDDEVFGQFKIVNVAGDGGIDDEESNEKALQMVRMAMTDHPEDTRTITISCGKLTTGVNIKPWTAVFMLAGTYSTSAANYMQTIFRVQTPATIGGRMKTDCYVFDFAPDRTLKVMVEAAQVTAKAKKDGEEKSDRELLGEFLNFCPIISYSGTEMKYYDVNSMMEHLKRVYVDRVVNKGFEDNHLYNDELMRLDGLALEEFNHLKGIIGATKANSKSNEVDVNNEGFTDEEYQREKDLKKKKKRDRTPEEEAELKRLQEKKKNRLNAISILRGISIRMPLMIYGAKLGDHEEITIDNFAEKVDDSSWDEFMPRGVTKELFAKFTKYYDPDIFRAAGRQIRDLARAADSMTITERVQRIATIFDSFKNPDKETVLTPWRVVNMHMSDTLGGYCFYDTDFEETIPEPRFVDRGDATRNVFAPIGTHILEINSKTGLYPLYLAYSIFRYRRDNKLDANLEDHALWDKILLENIFVVCKTPMAKEITRRTLRGFRTARVNARYFDDMINQIENKTENFTKRMPKGKDYWKSNSDNNMKFNAIVGNPPYQTQSKDNRATSRDMPVYNLFVDVSKLINPHYVSLIIPARWMATGLGLTEFRENMLNDTHIRELFDFPTSNDVFPKVDIKGGVCYFLRDRDYAGECTVVTSRNGNRSLPINRKLNEYDIFVRESNALAILKKILSHNESSIIDFLSVDKEFGWTSNFSDFDEEQNMISTVPLYYNRNGKRLIGYIARDKINKSAELTDTWKVMIPQAGSDGGKRIPDPVLGSCFIAPSPSVCTQTYLFLHTDSEKKAINMQKYVRTRFFRFLISLRKITQHATRSTYTWIPKQDFTSSSDINWKLPIEDIDKQLYKKYDIDTEEVNYIETMIKAM